MYQLIKYFSNKLFLIALTYFSGIITKDILKLANNEKNLYTLLMRRRYDDTNTRISFYITVWIYQKIYNVFSV